MVCVMLPALALTAARPWDTTAGLVIRMQAFAPLAIPLYAVVLVTCVAAGLLQTRGRRTPVLAGALVALTGLGLHLWWFAPQVVGEEPSPGDGAPKLTVMTANIYANHGDPVQLVDEAKQAHVDVLVVEEITEYALSRMDDAGLGELLPYRIGTAEGGVQGTMVFANERLGRPERLRTQFECWRVRVGALTMIAGHPVAPVAPTGPEQWRREHEIILDAAVEADADLVVGDLNASADHAVLRELEAAGFRDAAELANEGWQPTWPANRVGIIPWLPPVVRIDHVLVGPELTATRTHSVEIEGTDHLAVVAEVARR
jgi:endonuclease/exonuclease/phosphatase (EEP) superfamily protein YafD